MDRSKAARAKRRAEAEYRNEIVACELSQIPYFKLNPGNPRNWRPMNRSRADYLEKQLNEDINGIEWE